MPAGMLGFEADYNRDEIPQSAFSSFDEWYRSGRLGFWDLPVSNGLHEESQTLAMRLAEERDTLFVAGIGGSSLGLRAVLSALDPDNRRICLIDSPDSALIERMVAERDPGKSALCVITKSGGTAETLSIFMTLRKLLGTAVPVIAITDPEKGSLRKLVNEKGWHSLPVPQGVGGRFSVLSPVGMFPAAFAGIDTGSILAGALAVRKDYESRPAQSLAGQVAGAYLAKFRSHPVHVFMPYSDLLFETAQWFAQLWAESLGKAMDLHGNRVNTGQTPVACRGPADQHSLVQLFMEGPLDKTVTILSENFRGTGSIVPGEFSHVPSMAYLEGRSPDELRAAEAEATAKALRERGVPVSRFTLPAMDGHVLGQLFMILEIATVLCGLTLEVDPLDQPGVERGKVLTYAAMGREGY